MGEVEYADGRFRCVADLFSDIGFTSIVFFDFVVAKLACPDTDLSTMCRPYA